MKQRKRKIYVSAINRGSRRGKDVARGLSFNYLKSSNGKQHHKKNKMFYILSFINDLVRILFLKPSFIVFETAILNPYRVRFINVVYRYFKVSYALDVHTAAYVDEDNSIRTFSAKQKEVIANAAFLLVHNEVSMGLNQLFGKKFVLESRIPEIDTSSIEIKKLNAATNIVFITNFAVDEPIDLMLELTNNFKEDYHFYFTGNFKKKFQKDVSLPHNVTFTGFVPEREYDELLFNADILIVLTTRSYTLLYGGREALTFEKPMILSNNNANSAYFDKGALLCANDIDELSNAIMDLRSNNDRVQNEISILKKEKELLWFKRVKEIKAFIDTI